MPTIPNEARVRPLLIQLLELPTYEGVSVTSDALAEFNTDTHDTVTTPGTCTETEVSPITLIDPSAQGNCDVGTNPSMQSHTPTENGIMSGTSIATRPKSPSIDLFGTPAQRDTEVANSRPDISTPYDSDSDIQTVILCDSPCENDPLDSSGSSHKDPSAIPNTSVDDSSDAPSSGGSDTSSSGKTEASSIDSANTSPKSPPIAVFSPSPQENCDVKTSSSSEISPQDDSDSDIQTAIMCDSPTENDTSMLQSSSSDQKEPSTISNTSSDDPHDDSSDSSSDDSSWTVSDSSSGAKSESSSIDSFGTSSQQDSEPEEEQPRGSQSLAAYASSIRDGKRIRTSCDSVDDPGEWLVDPDGFINEKYRAGGPFLCSLPESILNLKGSSPLYTVLETISLHKMILSVLDEYNVNASSVTIKKCQYEFWPIMQPLPTLIITATRDTFSDAWVQACRKIWRHLSENQLGHINVEISDPALHTLYRSWPVESGHPIYPVHRKVMRRITEELNLTDWVTLGAQRVGTTSNVKDSEVVMLLTAHFKSNRDWRVPREQIISILEELKLPMVGVMIQKGKLWGRGYLD
ncbi:unnamed protein product [Penicillium nalgiovense]|uniref:Uncharacterized protein n=1 Tax=Penicillium nalgiovense TaxID=60175 RepID=A0A9W4N652_PENNA|nr:unnamed protein product [Penicillium nalgiovense]CAG8030193.1 unnamed protein product [Penicillium nalgiovense]CAG8031335.1 unnamed protein product [Penicillium nalgiovense]CAG8046842.1 unnamed protein product [Penicillium nalgiovense]CAG8047129.1 unnamed protein product [Penicillium nalgiovense]